MPQQLVVSVLPLAGITPVRGPRYLGKLPLQCKDRANDQKDYFNASKVLRPPPLPNLCPHPPVAHLVPALEMVNISGC